MKLLHLLSPILALVLFFARLTHQNCTTEFANAFLERTNVHRANHSVGNLTLNDTISKYAQEWAEELVKKGEIEHRNQSTYGENIFNSWYPDGHELPPEEAVDWFYDEIRFYDYFGQEPNFENRTKWGHFTQLVWSNSTSMGVGCGISSDNKSTYIVANYLPMGNIVTQFADNVLAPVGHAPVKSKKKKSKACQWIEQWCSRDGSEKVFDWD